MTLTSFLEHLPGLGYEVGIYRLDLTGMVLDHSGACGAVEFKVNGNKLDVGVDADRAPYAYHWAQTDEWWVITYEANQGMGEQFREFLAALFAVLSEKSQLEHDMESMYASSLTLLEEVSMVGEVMSKLPTGENESAIVTMGLDALMVASSVHRAIYARFHPELGECEMLVHLVMDQATRKPVPAALPDEVWFDARSGLVGRAICGSGSAIMESVLADGRLGAMGSPEWYAQEEVIAAPVLSGDGEDAKVLGVVCIMDKRETAYSSVTRLGSQESKMVRTIYLMLGSVLGTRRAVELDKEMNMAMEIQRQILPECPANVAGYDLAGLCLASGFVGGDYFDYLPMNDGRTMAVVADVSGHNLASGMLMVGARATLRSLASMHEGVGEIFTSLGRTLFEDLHRTERFITAAGVALTGKGPGIDLVNAGHNDTMIYRHEREEVESIPSGGPILGFLDGIDYSEVQRELAFGDVLILYTDGITEATNSEGEMYEEARLAAALLASAQFSAQGILDSILSDLARFADKCDERDDVTLVVVRRVGDTAS